VKFTRILFIEDSPGDALLVRQIVAELPYPIRLSVARDGEQALMILADPELDAALIILDLNIPKVSGEAVLERNPRKDIPVVIFSVSANPADVQRTMDLGAREYVVKPMDMLAYKATVVRMIEKWALPAANGATGST
jgi:chemotaxis family two-component system response regulator Rcp1